MNSWRHLVAVGGLLLALGVPALAQTTPAPPNAQARGQRGGGRQGGLTSLPVTAIDAIVTLKADQKTKITAIQDKLKEDMRAAAGDRQKAGELRTQATSDIKAVLTEEQAKTLQDTLPTLSLLNASRIVPYGALAEVKLTKDQLDKMQPIVKEEQEKLRGVARTERQAKMAEITTDFKSKTDTILTQAQKDVVAKYVAAHPRGARGAGGARGNT
jgi:Spy/CpxP family protein refolding chaperone